MSGKSTETLYIESCMYKSVLGKINELQNKSRLIVQILLFQLNFKQKSIAKPYLKYIFNSARKPMVCLPFRSGLE